MGRVLVAYTTLSGSTAELAEVIAKELTGAGAQVDALSVRNAGDISSYDAVVVGGPMILGWHREAVAFLQSNQQVLKHKPLACFATALSLTKPGNGEMTPFPVFLDPSLAKPAKNPARLSYKENYATVSSYLKPVLSKAPELRPASMAFFAGKLDYGRLNLFNRLFVQVIIGGKAGDYRNWDAVRAWSASLAPLLTR
jgi:menaquinone-dependent protoporphyrinogen oxidase